MCSMKRSSIRLLCKCAIFRNVEWHLLGNHVWANAKALIFGGACFGSEANGWLHKGLDILAEQ